MLTEDQLLPISALQHLLFCERQCALIHVERLWAENRWTVEGNHLHQKAHGEDNHPGKTRIEKGVRIARGLRLRSLEFGLTGQADVVEFHDKETAIDGDEQDQKSTQLDTGYQNQRVIPVEYKRGKPKKNDCDRVQICAQTMCLEEMLDVQIAVGHLFYGKRKRRTEVRFDESLRATTMTAIERLREMIDSRETPNAVRAPKCDSCSLLNLCLPDCMRLKTGAGKFHERQLATVLAAEGPDTDDFENDEP